MGQRGPFRKLQKKHKKSLFVFRRDLRLYDNTGLRAALAESETVIPCFIFDPRQIETNRYRGNSSIQFMLESLSDLAGELKKKNSRLFVFYGQAQSVIEELIERESIDAIYLNRDYTPFSRTRDKAIETIAKQGDVEFNSFPDLLLIDVNEVFTGKATAYTVYSHFAKKAMQFPVAKPKVNNFRNYYNKEIEIEAEHLLKEILPKTEFNNSAFVSGGRSEALALLKRIPEFSNYREERDIPCLEATTGLSAHNKFGTVSIREVYHAIAQEFGTQHTLIRELYWRDFFSYVAYHYPHVFGKAFHQKYNSIAWSRDRKKFDAWSSGKTGFPLVDAGMRQLNETGFMHNRVRMVVASFLVKDLQISWRWGERYFAQRLVDYDPAVNNGNWQWAASTGCDAQPYFRIFNPWIQQKKFDPDCKYIQRWVPELRKFSSKEIHRLEKGVSLSGYPEAIVDHREAKQLTEELFADVLEKQYSD